MGRKVITKYELFTELSPALIGKRIMLEKCEGYEFKEEYDGWIIDPFSLTRDATYLRVANKDKSGVIEEICFPMAKIKCWSVTRTEIEINEEKANANNQ